MIIKQIPNRRWVGNFSGSPDVGHSPITKFAIEKLLGTTTLDNFSEYTVTDITEGLSLMHAALIDKNPLDILAQIGYAGDNLIAKRDQSLLDEVLKEFPEIPLNSKCITNLENTGSWAQVDIHTKSDLYELILIFHSPSSLAAFYWFDTMQ